MGGGHHQPLDRGKTTAHDRVPRRRGLGYVGALPWRGAAKHHPDGIRPLIADSFPGPFCGALEVLGRAAGVTKRVGVVAVRLGTE